MKNGGKSRNVQSLLERINFKINSSLCSLKNGNCTVNMFVGT